MLVSIYTLEYKALQLKLSGQGCVRRAAARACSHLQEPFFFHMSYSLNSLKGGYIGDYIGDYCRVY